MHLSNKKYELVRAKTDGHCAFCGVQLDLASETGSRVSKIVPTPAYDDKDTRNMVLSCWDCGSIKARKDLEEFRDTYSFRLNSDFGIIPLVHGRTLRDAGLIPPWDLVEFTYEGLLQAIVDEMTDHA